MTRGSIARSFAIGLLIGLVVGYGGTWMLFMYLAGGR